MVPVTELLERRTLFSGNLLLNGSFESPAIGVGASGLGYTNYAAGTTIGSGWKVTTNNVDVVSDKAGTAYASAAGDGHQYVDMAGSTAGAVSQTAATVAGGTYQLAFAWTATPFGGGGAPDVRQMHVTFAGKTIATLSKSVDGETPGKPGWKTSTYVVVAASTSSAVTFVNDTGGGFGMALDDVTLTADGGVVSGTVTGGQAGETVYLDANDNAKLDTGELRTTTSSAGKFAFTAVPAAAYVVRQVLPAGYSQTSPTGGGGVKVTVTAGSSFTAANFGDKLITGSIGGRVFDDVNGNGTRDAGEAGLGLFTVYIDANANGKLDAGERSVVTDVYGDWSFTGLLAGTYTIRVVPVTGLTATKPTGGVLTIKLALGQSSVNNLIGEKATT